MKEKYLFVYDTMVKAVNDLNSKKISVEHAKAAASIAKQLNNVIAAQLDAAKFMANTKDASAHLEEVGLIDEAKDIN